MGGGGLKEVSNPSELFLGDRESGAFGLTVEPLTAARGRAVVRAVNILAGQWRFDDEGRWTRNGTPISGRPICDIERTSPLSPALSPAYR